MKAPKFISERLILRAIKANDIFDIAEIVSDKETSELFGGIEKENDLYMFNFVELIQEDRQANTSFFWSITMKENLDFIGFIRLISCQSEDSNINNLLYLEGYTDSTDNNGWEIDYVLLKPYRGNRYMSESINVILNFAINERLLPMYARVQSVKNKSSIAILKKYGFKDLFPITNVKNEIGMLYKFEY